MERDTLFSTGLAATDIPVSSCHATRKFAVTYDNFEPRNLTSFCDCEELTPVTLATRAILQTG